MITIKYTKTDFARFLSHLDLQSIIIRSIKRTGFLPTYSQGFNPHPILKMSPPIPLGVASLAEYFSVDIPLTTIEDFVVLLNKNLPKGISCVKFWKTEITPKLMGLAIAARYKILRDISHLNVLQLKKSFIEKGNFDVEKLTINNFSIESFDGGNYVTLPLGKNNYRIDKFIEDIRELNFIDLSTKDVLKDALFLSYPANSPSVINADEYLFSNAID